jgi:ribosomal protein S18 acetylase RimI-like enzyme
MQIRRLNKAHFEIVKDFYVREIEKLERKEFFLPYTDEELRGVLENGYFLGVFDDEKLVATSAIDFDWQYGEKLKTIISPSKKIDKETKVYEFSGVFTAKTHRNKKLASLLASSLLDFSKSNLPNSYLCAVIEPSNTPSQNHFLRHGFTLAHKAKDFYYFLLACENIATN